MKKNISGWIIYLKKEEALTLSEDYSVLRLLEEATKKNISLKVFTPEQFDLIITKNDNKSILIDEEPHAIPDFILPRIGSNSKYFTLAVLRHLEQLGVYICNNAAAIELVKDKLHCHQIMSHHNLPIPKTMLLKFPVAINIVKKEIGFPAIIKNISGQKGAGIYLSESSSKFEDLMELIHENNANANIILQEYIQTSHGRDLRVFVVGGKIIGCMQRTSKDGNFKANFSRGGSTESHNITQEIEWLVTETVRITGLDIAGIDLLFDTEGFKVCEANSAPGFKGLEKALKENIAEQIIDYILFKVSQIN